MVQPRPEPVRAESAARPLVRLVRQLLLFVPVAALMALISWTVDPAYIFGRARLVPAGQVANAWLAGRHVILGNWNLDERLVMRYYARRLWPWQAPSVLVIGSSRAMKLHRSQFADRSFFNTSVSGASLEDHLAIYELFRERGLKPRTVVLGVDPWLLNRHNRQPRWVTLEPEYRRASERLLGRRSISSALLAGVPTTKALELFSPAYFQASLSVAFGLSQRPTITDGEMTVPVTDRTAVDEQIHYADGSIEDSEKVRHLTREYVREDAIAVATSERPYSLGDFTRLDPDLMGLFERFVFDLQGSGITTVFYLPPYHPAAYQRLIEQPKFRILLDVEDYFRRFAAARGIVVHGSYDPVPCGLDESDFTDSMHTTRRAIEKAFPCLVPAASAPPAPVTDRGR